jgi:hypothetical protein
MNELQWTMRSWSNRLLLLGILACVCTAESLATGGLRTSSVLDETAAWEQLPVVERVYGAANTAVRKNIRSVEERMPRYQTGQAPDPSHVVPYHHHPYDKATRRLQQEGKNTTSRFAPIRMHFETVALDQMSTQDPANAEKIACTLSAIE